MINNNDRIKDSEDVGVLFHALIRFVEVNEERLDMSVAAIGYGNLLELADTAAEVIALRHVEEGDAWDNVRWFERLERLDDDSLAAALLEPDVDVETVVQVWLDSLH